MEIRSTGFGDLPFEAGIIWNIRPLKIDWKIKHPSPSKKDWQLPPHEELLRKSLISPKSLTQSL